MAMQIFFLLARDTKSETCTLNTERIRQALKQEIGFFEETGPVIGLPLAKQQSMSRGSRP